MKKHLIIIVFLSALAIHSCKKVDKSSIYYFSCKVNGIDVDFYPAEESGFHSDDFGADFTKGFKVLNIRGWSEESKSVHICIADTAKQITTGDFNLTTGNTGVDFMRYRDYNSSDLLAYNTDSVNIGTLHLEVDKNAETVKGTFYGKLKYQDISMNKAIEITEGKFFITYDAF